MQRVLMLMLMMALGGMSAAAQDPTYVSTWAAAPMAVHATATDGKTGVTLREIVHVTTAGRQLMSITLSNEFGADPLTIGAASVALRASGSTVETPVRDLTFGGKPGVVIPPHGTVISDLATWSFPAMSDVVVSLFVPAQKMTTVTQHKFANSTNYVAPGDQVDAGTLHGATEIASWLYLKNVEVNATQDAGLIVCLGDSITDGGHSTKDANDRWPDELERRLQASPDKRFADFGVDNEGIGGNRILHKNAGPSALARFDSDVASHTGNYQTQTRYLIILEGINDIGHAYDPVAPHDMVSTADLIAGYTKLAQQAHRLGFKVYGGTLTPYIGAKYASPAGEAVREALNQWIRTTKELDGFIDFEKIIRDPANPTMYLPAYDSGDHLHPNDAGYKAMGDGIDLKLFER